jgi:hypothetical protein
MNLYKSDISSVLKSMIDESLEFVKAHINWIQTHELDDPMTDQVSRQLSNHLMILHWSFPIIRDLFSAQELEAIVSEDMLSNMETIYIEGLKKGYVFDCQCDYCALFTVEEAPKKEIKKAKRMKVRYGN